MFGWSVAFTEKDEWLISRDNAKLKIDKGNILLADLPVDYPTQPAITLPELLALLVLEK